MKAKTRVFCPNGLHRNELMRLRIVGRCALNALREKVCPIERNYFRGCKKRITWHRVVYNGRKSQSFRLGAGWNFVGRILISGIVRGRFCPFVCKDRL